MSFINIPDGNTSTVAGDVSIIDKNTLVPLIVNPDGSINVVSDPTPSTIGSVKNTYNEILAVVSGSQEIIVSYTVPANVESVLQKVAFSGENIARYDVFINGLAQDTARTMFGSDLTGKFDFTTGDTSGLLLVTGDTVQVEVIHSRPYTADFEARIQVLEITI